MGITYQDDSESGLFVSNWSGAITINDMAQHWHRVLEQMQKNIGKGSLIDFGDARPLINFTDLTTFVSTIIVPTHQGGKWKTAIVAHDPFQYGAARQFEKLVDKYLELNVFTEREEARRWLES